MAIIEPIIDEFYHFSAGDKVHCTLTGISLLLKYSCQDMNYSWILEYKIKINRSGLF
ncbi:MAG: hypothetical protein U0T33_02950 [Bacteroidales bacterium]